MTPTPEDIALAVRLSQSGTRAVINWSELIAAHCAPLRRDAERFRKLEAQHDGCTGAQWCSRYGTVYYASSSTLADIADALPALTDGKRRNDG